MARKGNAASLDAKGRSTNRRSSFGVKTPLNGKVNRKEQRASLSGRLKGRKLTTIFPTR